MSGAASTLAPCVTAKWSRARQDGIADPTSAHNRAGADSTKIGAWSRGLAR